MPQQTSQSQTSSELQNSHFTILVVEDEPAIRMIAADILRDAGYTVAETSTATEAFVRLQRCPPNDLAFSGEVRSTWSILPGSSEPLDP